MSKKILPTFKGYTVDLKVQEFRRMVPGKTKMEVIRFLSKKGWKIFGELMDFAEEVLEFYEYK
jgi:hypothetical protein